MCIRDRFRSSDHSVADSPARFKFTLLNDGPRMKADRSELDKLSRDVNMMKHLPAEIQQGLDHRLKLEQAEVAQRHEEHRETLIKGVREQLEGGMTVRRVKQQLQPRTYVIEFDDTKTTGANLRPIGTKQLVHQFSQAVSLMVATASPFDEVVIKITSPGGAVTEYGLASSQLVRLKRAGIATTVCVDTVAASGGYMMACVADKLVAAPFSLLGSIGVVAGMPNLSKVLRKNDIDYLLFTAGKFKRTVTALTEVTDEARDKFQDQLEEIHTAFSAHVDSNRGVDIDQVATGEAWLGLQCQDKGLVDHLMTSEEYLRSKMEHTDVILVEPKLKEHSFKQLLSGSLADMATAVRELWGGVWSPAAEMHQAPVLKDSSVHSVANLR
eukprot:TRINITY_DN8209_c0_g1_i1.p1 TRINITY_DN8209_c0_g1~~TRINITY_DN8209_c0_g1_i1.p1  ORF type:complete len:383 (-),score=89.33 TRINITY_DN8209_c0_g1_i1:52-1200(-)